VILWDAEKLTVVGQVSPEQRHEKRVAAVAYRPDGQQIASASEDGTVKLWEIRGDSLRVTATLTGHAGAVTSVRYVPSGQLLASAGADGSAKLWDVRGTKLTEPDLFTYLDRNWYAFTPEARWSKGAGLATLDAPELAGIWKTAPDQDLASVWKTVLKDKHWRRAALLRRQGVALPPEVAEGLSVAVLPLKPKAKDTFLNGKGGAMIWCPPGSFVMGSPETEKDRQVDEDVHEVTLSGFWLGKFEVTQAEWLAVMGRNPASRKDPANPVEMVNWEEATEFCKRLTDLERARGTLPPGWIYTLPTEAQWEYACRAETKTAWSFGDDPAQLFKNGNYNDITGNFVGNDTEHDDKHQYTAPVGKFAANPWGFHDMHGNVWEWCADWYDGYPAGPVTDPTGPSVRVQPRVPRGRLQRLARGLPVGLPWQAHAVLPQRLDRLPDCRCFYPLIIRRQISERSERLTRTARRGSGYI